MTVPIDSLLIPTYIRLPKLHRSNGKDESTQMLPPSFKHGIAEWRYHPTTCSLLPMGMIVYEKKQINKKPVRKVLKSVL
jgi:hypothetical protein